MLSPSLAEGFSIIAKPCKVQQSTQGINKKYCVKCNICLTFAEGLIVPHKNSLMSLNRYAICILFPDADSRQVTEAMETHHVAMVGQEAFDIEKEYSTYFSEYNMPASWPSIHLLFIFAQNKHILADTEDKLAEALEYIIKYKKEKAQLS